MLSFFRGITVPNASTQKTMEDIRSRGLLPDQGRCRMSHRLPINPAALFEQPDLTHSETRAAAFPEYLTVCACGDVEGAAHYAWRQNRTPDNDTPIIVEFVAPASDIAVDGKDFLYTAFSLGVPELTKEPLIRCFGDAVLRYAEKAWASPHGCSLRIAMCDLAIHDPAVISAHHANTLPILGRHSLIFYSAFTVRLPIEANRITRVFVPTEEIRHPSTPVKLDDVITRTH